ERPRRRVGEVESALALHAVKLLVGGVLVHGALGAGIIAVHPGMKMIRAEQHFFAVPDLEFLDLEDVDEFSGHLATPFSSCWEISEKRAVAQPVRFRMRARHAAPLRVFTRDNFRRGSPARG